MRSLFTALIVLALLSACSRGEQHSGLPTAKIAVETRRGPVTFSVEIAADDASREKGLMFRTVLAPNAGMLFDFQTPRFVNFWMKNTPLSLDILFIRSDGTVSTIADNTVPYSTDSIPSSEPVRAVLEINGGRSAALGIQPGAKVHAAIFGNGP